MEKRVSEERHSIQGRRSPGCLQKRQDRQLLGEKGKIGVELRSEAAGL